MNAVITPKKVNFALNDGSTVDLTVSFALLKKLQNHDRTLTDRYFAITGDKALARDHLNMVTMVYVFYCCACIDAGQTFLSEDEFIELVPYDIESLGRVMNELLNPKKKQASVPRS